MNKFNALLTVVVICLSGCAKVGMKASPTNRDGAEVVTAGATFDTGLYNNKEGTKYMAPYDQVYYFDFDKYEAHDEDVNSVIVQAEYLKNHPAIKIKLSGHTDIRGTLEYNNGLGERRAKSIKDILLLHNVNKNQISMVSYGSLKPVDTGTTEGAYRLNRRVELTYEGLH